MVITVFFLVVVALRLKNIFSWCFTYTPSIGGLHSCSGYETIPDVIFVTLQSPVSSAEVQL